MFKAFRYRYFSRLPILKSESIASAVAHIDFENPTTYADIGDFESLFWFSFFSLSVMEQYFRVYGFEKFQQLLSAIIYYPYEREAEGPFPILQPAPQYATSSPLCLWKTNMVGRGRLSGIKKG